MNDITAPLVSGEGAQPSSVMPQPIDRAVFDGRRSRMFSIFFRSLLLSIPTFSFYRFWGKTQMRQYVWSHLRLKGEPFEYLGTGGELCRGFLKAVGVLVPLLIGFGLLRDAAESSHPGLGDPVDQAQTIIFLGLFYVGSYAALRYRMSRTSWCGIRFTLGGSPTIYGLQALRGYFLSVLTLGLYTPYFSVRQRAYYVQNLAFGSLPFAFDGKGSDLFRPFFTAWVLFLPTLGLSMFWYASRATAYYASRTSIGGWRFAMPISAKQYFALIVPNFLMMLLSLGLLTPLVMARNFEFWSRNFEIHGVLDPTMIRQAADASAHGGEGLASFLDVDAGIG